MNNRETMGRLWVLMATACVDMIGFLMIVPLIPFYAHDLGASDFVIGVLISAFSAAQLLTSPLWGRVSDRYGRRPALMAGLLSSAFAYALFAYANSVWLLLVCRLVQGAGGGTTGVVQAYVSDTVAPGERAKALGWLSAATNLGVMIGPAIASLCAHFGSRAPGLIAAGLCVVNAAFAWRYLPESSSEMGQKIRRSIRGAFAELMRHPGEPVSLLIWIYAAGMLAFSVMTGMLALYLARRFGITAKTIGYFYTYVGGISFLMRAVLLGPTVKRFGEVRMMRMGAVALILGLGFLPFAPTIPVFGVVVLLVPVGTALLFPATSSLVSRYSPPTEVGQTLGLQQSFGGVARMLGPAGGGALFQRYGPGAPFWMASGVMLLAAFFTSRLSRAEARVKAPAAAAAAEFEG